MDTETGVLTFMVIGKINTPQYFNKWKVDLF